MVPAQITVARIEDEWEAIVALATRRGWTVRSLLDELTLEFRTVHPADGQDMLLVASMQGYPAMPPNWIFVDPETRERTRAAFPKPGEIPELQGSSVFIDHDGQGVICAHWNLDAYAFEGHKGPHSEWGDAAGWINASRGYTRAENLAEMLSTIDMHLQGSRERLS